MDIQNEINRINENVANTYSALSDMGATMPETQNSANMASTVRTIPQTGNAGNTEAVFEVTCVFREGSSEHISSVSATFEEIYNAVKVEHKCVVLTAKLGTASYTSESCRILPMTFLSDGAVTFEGIVSGYDGSYRIKVTITNDGVSSELIAGIGDIYYIYCNVDLDNNTFAPYTTTVGDLSEALSGQHTVILTANINGTYILLPMSSMGDGGVTFNGVVKLEGSFYFVSAEILSDGNKFTITEVSQTGGGSGGSGGGVLYAAGDLIEIEDGVIGSTLGKLVSTTEEVKDEIINIGCVIFDGQLDSGEYEYNDVRYDFTTPNINDVLKIEITPQGSTNSLIFENIKVYALKPDTHAVYASFNTDIPILDMLTGTRRLIKTDESLPAGIIGFVENPNMEKTFLLMSTDDLTRASFRVTSNVLKNNYVKLPDNALEAGNNIKIENGVISSTIGEVITDDYVTILEPTALTPLPADSNPFVGFNLYMIEKGKSSNWISVNEPIELYMIDSLGNETNLGTVIPKFHSVLDSVSAMMGVPFVAVNVNVSNSIDDVIVNARFIPKDEDIPYAFMFFAVPIASTMTVGCLASQSLDGCSLKLRKKNRVNKAIFDNISNGLQVQPPFYSWSRKTDSTIPAGKLLHMYAYDTNVSMPISYYVGSCCLEDNIIYNTAMNIEPKEQAIGTVNISNSIAEIFTTGNVVPEDSTIPYSFAVIFDYSKGYVTLTSGADAPGLTILLAMDEHTEYINKIPADMLLDLTYDNTPTEGSQNLVMSGDIYNALNAITAEDVGALPNTTQIPTVPTNVSEFTNDAGYLTEHQSLSDYALKTDLNNKQDKLTLDEAPTEGGTNPITSGAVYSVIGDIDAALAQINILIGGASQ